MKKYSYQKENNIAKTPEYSVNNHKTKKVNSFFLLITIISIAVYSCYTFLIIYRLTQKTFLSKIIIYLLGLYVFVFLLLILVNLGNKKRMKNNLKDYKSATKFLKYSIQIINFILSIVTLVSAFITTGKTDFSSLAFAFASLFLTIIFIFIEIISIKIRKNLPLIKKNFFEIREKPYKKHD